MKFVNGERSLAITNDTRYTWRRPINYTYQYMLEKLGDPSQLSARKRMCLAYMKWGYTCSKDDRAEFVECAKQFRREQKRHGGHRTILEIKARKLFRVVRKYANHKATREGAREHAKKQVREKTGVHSPEVVKKASENARSGLENRAKSLKKKGNKYKWICRNIATGEVVETSNLAEFRRMYGIPENGSTKTNRKIELIPVYGWMIERYNPEW